MKRRSGEVRTETTTRSEIDAFVAKVRATPVRSDPVRRGRLLFCIDATLSRQPTWDIACDIQADMFRETEAIGGLEVQLAWFRGLGEFRAHKWVPESAPLQRQMSTVRCAPGRTQIVRVLRHALAEHARNKIDAIIYIGDCVEETPHEIYAAAGELGLCGAPVFAFHEGYDTAAESVFREIARLSGGAFARFDVNSARQLRELLSAVAVYASGGRKALSQYGKKTGSGALMLAHQMR